MIWSIYLIFEGRINKTSKKNEKEKNNDAYMNFVVVMIYGLYNYNHH